MPKPELLLFLHIPKTAGSTLHPVLRRQFPKDQQLRYNNRDNVNHLSLLSKDQLAKIKMLRGHFPFGFHENLSSGSFEYITMLRDPVERVISLYRYLLRTPTHSFYDEWKRHQYSLPELMESGKLFNVNDTMVRMISGNYTLPYGSINEHHLQQALDNLDKYFPVVGLQHQFDHFLLELGDHYGWRSLWYRNRLVADKNANSIQLDRDEASIAAIQKYNRMDQLLYDEIVKRKKVQYDNLGIKFEKRVERFRMINRTLTKIVNHIPFFPPAKS